MRTASKIRVTYSEPGSDGSETGSSKLKGFSVFELSSSRFVSSGVLELETFIFVIVIFRLVRCFVVEVVVSKLELLRQLFAAVVLESSAVHN